MTQLIKVRVQQCANPSVLEHLVEHRINQKLQEVTSTVLHQKQAKTRVALSQTQAQTAQVQEQVQNTQAMLHTTQQQTQQFQHVVGDLTQHLGQHMGGLQQEIQQLKTQQAELMFQNQQLQKQLSDSQDDCSANVPKGEKLSPSPEKALTFPSPDKETSTEEVIGLAKEMATSSPLPLPSQTKPRPRMKLPTGPESEKFLRQLPISKLVRKPKPKGRLAEM
jgi:uncharacterized phage infection (PIP) family protein YhgE